MKWSKIKSGSIYNINSRSAMGHPREIKKKKKKILSVSFTSSPKTNGIDNILLQKPLGNNKQTYLRPRGFVKITITLVNVAMICE